MVHGVEELILVDEAADSEVDSPGEEDLPGFAKDAVDDADDKDEEDLGEEKAVVEGCWLVEFGVVCDERQ